MSWRKVSAGFFLIGLVALFATGFCLYAARWMQPGPSWTWRPDLKRWAVESPHKPDLTRWAGEHLNFKLVGPDVVFLTYKFVAERPAYSAETSWFDPDMPHLERGNPSLNFLGMQYRQESFPGLGRLPPLLTELYFVPLSYVATASLMTAVLSFYGGWRCLRQKKITAPPLPAVTPLNSLQKITPKILLSGFMVLFAIWLACQWNSLDWLTGLFSITIRPSYVYVVFYHFGSTHLVIHPAPELMGALPMPTYEFFPGMFRAVIPWWCILGAYLLSTMAIMLLVHSRRTRHHLKAFSLESQL